MTREDGEKPSGGHGLPGSAARRRLVLRDNVTVEQAEDVLWALCSFEAFDGLYTARGRSLDETIEVIIWTAEHALCRPAA
jgi:hypothetical protein